MQKYKAAQDAVATSANKLSEERLSNLPLVKLAGTESVEREAYASLMSEATRLSRKSAVADGVFLGSMFTSTAMVLAGVMSAGGRLCREGKLTPGQVSRSFVRSERRTQSSNTILSLAQLTSYATYTFLFGAGAAGVAKAMSEFGAGVDAAVEVYGLIDRCRDAKGEGRPKRQGGKAPVGGDVVVKNLSYTYEGSSIQALKNISLKVSAGEIVALTGENGSGKVRTRIGARSEAKRLCCMKSDDRSYWATTSVHSSRFALHELLLLCDSLRSPLSRSRRRRSLVVVTVSSSSLSRR